MGGAILTGLGRTRAEALEDLEDLEKQADELGLITSRGRERPYLIRANDRWYETWKKVLEERHGQEVTTVYAAHAWKHS